MNIRALEAQAKALAPVLRGLIDKAVSALSSRIDDVERALSELPSIENAVKEAVASLPPAKDGKDAEVDLDQIVREVIARVPAPKDGADGQPGKSLTPEDVRPIVAEGSLAAISRSYAVAAQQIFNNDLPFQPTGSYNAELVVQLSPQMQAKLNHAVAPAKG